MPSRRRRDNPLPFDLLRDIARSTTPSRPSDKAPETAPAEKAAPAGDAALGELFAAAAPAGSSSDAGGPDGLSRWRADRRSYWNDVARALGVPVGQNVEVRLCSGDTFRGRLVLADADLLIRTDLSKKRGPRMADLELAVGRARFTAADIESVARLDESPPHGG